MAVCISPSLASAPMAHLADVIKQLEAHKVDMIHFDVEDGSFVPMMTHGIKIIEELRNLTKLPFDVHLMMVNPDWLIPQLVKMGANRIAVHIEACPYPRKTLRTITESGLQAGLAFNPATPIPQTISYLFPYLSFINILTSEPELPDSPFLPNILDKLRMGKMLPELKHLEWVVDGGINLDNLHSVVEAGADTIVIGRAIFDRGKIAENLQHIRTKIRNSQE